MEINPTKKKAFSNVRTHAADEKIILTPPRIFSLEDAISYIRGRFALKFILFKNN